MRKLCFVLFAFVFVLSATDNSKTAPVHYESPADYTPDRGTLLFEGFESGIMPPAGWDTVMVSGGTHWDTSTQVGYIHSGSFGALHPWGFTLDNWIRRPTLDFSGNDSLLLKFWWNSSYYWHVDPYDNGDLFVEVSTDGGTNWDTLWTFGDSAMVVNSGGVWPWTNWTWYQATLNLSDYGGESNVIIAFHVVADDNADIAIDDIEIDTIITGPNIDVTPTSIDTTYPLNFVDTLAFTIGNIGGDTIFVDSITNAATLVTAIWPDSFAFGPGEDSIFYVRIETGVQTEYFDTVFVHSNDPDENPFIVPIHVKCSPDIDIYPVVIDTALPFGIDTFDFTVTNVGGEDLQVDSIRNTGTFITNIWPDFFILPSGIDTTFYTRVDVSSKGKAGEFFDTVLVYSNDPDENPFIIPIHVINSPDITVSVSEISVIVPPQTYCTDGFDVGNEGTDTLRVSSITYSAAWIDSVTPNIFNVNTDGQVPVTVYFYSPSVEGDYYDTLWINSNDPDETPYPIPVHLQATNTFILIDEDFESGMPGDWTVVDGNSDGATWTVGTTGDLLGFTPPDYGTQYAYYSDDDAGSSSPQTPGEDLITPALFATPYDSIVAMFAIGWQSIGSNDHYGVFNREFTGGSWSAWTMAVEYPDDDSLWDTLKVTAKLSADSVQFMWRYWETAATYAWACAVDNITITGYGWYSGLPIEKDFRVNVSSIVRDLIDIKFTRPAPENLNVRLFNVVGRRVESSVIRMGSMNSCISLKKLPAGVYFISIDGSRNYLKQKVIHIR